MNDSSTQPGKAPPAWVKKYLPWIFLLGIVLVWWAPGRAPKDAPASPCPQIAADEFAQAITAGAVRGTIQVAADGTSSAEFGPGMLSCSGGAADALKVCKRAVDLVIEYQPEDGVTFFVRVPAGSEYRFKPQNAPNTCEILDTR
jgi:hypothetical protein